MPPPVRHNIPLLIYGAVTLLINRAELACGVRKRRDGWRRATGLVLRGEASSFVLSAFGLDPWPPGERPTNLTMEQTQARIADRLRLHFAGEPCCRVRIVNAARESRPEPCPHPSYTLAFAPWVDGPARFLKPTDWNSAQRTPQDAGDDPAPLPPNASPLMNAVCRIGPRGECDLWLRINHVGADGVPMQEMLTRLESAWRSASPVLYPTPESFEPFARPRPAPGREGLAELQFFADFAPLLAWRKRNNARLAEPMTVAAALLWQLGRLPELSRFRFGTTVDIPPGGEGREKGDMARRVGVVVTRASDYDRHNPTERLERFVRRFNRDVDLNRRRASFGCGVLDASAVAPPPIAAAHLRFVLTKASLAFGSIGLTMLKDARVFGAPIAEVGHGRGFIAVGSVSLPCEDGRPGGVGCVTVKGDAGTIDAWPRLIRSAIAACENDRP